jgi:hypothetical protein
MRNALSIQRTNDGSFNHQKPLITVSLWIVQGLLALLFLFTGGTKLFLPIEVLLAQMTVPLPGLFVRFIGLAEVTGALGLILPGLLRIRPGLTWLAGYCLIVVLIGAVVVTLIGGDVIGALFPLVVGLLCATVAYGRRSWKLA